MKNNIKNNTARLCHPIAPVYDSESTILILGSFPSVKSREDGFYYAHKQNRFWKVLAGINDCTVPQTREEKITFLKSCHIALWDVIKSCDIAGSSDSSIKNAVPNDISQIINTADIKRIFVNGKTAQRLYEKYIQPNIGIKACTLPSTSPANAAWSLERLIDYWRDKIMCDKNISDYR